MSKLPLEHWTMRDAPSAALTFAQRRRWASIANLALRMHGGDEQEALAIANAAMHDKFWLGDDFLVGAWNKHYAAHSYADEADNSEPETPPANDDGLYDAQATDEVADGLDLDEVQHTLAANVEARRAFYDYTVAEATPVTINTERSSTDLNPVEIAVIEERPTTDAERGLKLYEDHVEHLNEMDAIYAEYDQQLCQKYLEGK